MVDSEQDLVFNLQCLQKRSARKRFRRSIFDEWPECAYCGKENPTTLDHVVPKARGGSTTRQNLVGCCGDCNITKAHQDVLEWWRAQTFWDLERETALFVWLSENHPVTQSKQLYLRNMLSCAPLLPNVA
jgi:5-methylcytosine-specific restriction endonuclease McrA